MEWEPISLLFKNDPAPGSDRYRANCRTHGMLRVMESVRTELGNDGVFHAYWGSEPTSTTTSCSISTSPTC